MTGLDASYAAAAITALVGGICAAALFFWRAGGNSGAMKTAIGAATDAVTKLGESVERNTEVTAGLSASLAVYQARTDTRLDEHQRMLVQHDKRLSEHDQRIGRQ